MSRLPQLIANADGAVSIYICAGHPSMAASEANLRAALDGGAHFVEIGIPFSDPAADGPVIENAAAHALRNGANVKEILAMAKRIRADYPDAGLVCMTYANIAYQMTWSGFAGALADAGFDGAILPDIPLEESGPIRDALAARNVGWVPLVTPTTDAARMAELMATATGFVYVVSNVGTTGQADPGPLVESVVQRARAADATVPLVVGFGLQTQADVSRVLAAGAHGAIVGSALVQLIDDGASTDDVQAFVAGLRPGKP